MGPQGGQLQLQYKIYQNKQTNTTKQNKNINGIQEQSDNRDTYASLRLWLVKGRGLVRNVIIKGNISEIFICAWLTKA